MLTDFFGRSEVLSPRMAEACSQDRPPLPAPTERVSLDQLPSCSLLPSLHSKYHDIHHPYAGRLETKYQAYTYM